MYIYFQVDMVVGPVGSYVVDLMGPRSAEGTAALSYVPLLTRLRTDGRL